MKFLSGFFNHRQAVQESVLTPEEAWALRKKSRAERRREERESLKSATARACWLCGYGAVKGVPGSNLIRGKNDEGEDAWVHASPVACSGMIAAITSQARESIPQVFSDLARILWIRTEGYARLYWARFIQFLKAEDANEYHGGTSASRENTQVGST